MIQSIQFINANYNIDYECCTISTIYNDIYTLYFLRFSWNALASIGLYISNIFSKFSFMKPHCLKKCSCSNWYLFKLCSSSDTLKWCLQDEEEKPNNEELREETALYGVVVIQQTVIEMFMTAIQCEKLFMIHLFFCHTQALKAVYEPQYVHVHLLWFIWTLNLQCLHICTLANVKTDKCKWQDYVDKLETMIWMSLCPSFANVIFIDQWFKVVWTWVTSKFIGILLQHSTSCTDCYDLLMIRAFGKSWIFHQWIWLIMITGTQI